MAETITFKRQVSVKTVVNEEFRSRASGELTREVTLLEEQLNQLETSYKSTLEKLEGLSDQGHNVRQQVEQLNQEAQSKRNQLMNLKMEVKKQLASLDKVPDGGLVVTGVLESLVDVGVGDNIYQKVQGAEVIVENGLIKEIRG